MSLPLDQNFLGDCREVMKTFPDKSIDLVLTDPVWPNALPTLIGSDDPYGLFAEEFTAECSRKTGQDNGPRTVPSDEETTYAVAYVWYNASRAAAPPMDDSRKYRSSARTAQRQRDSS
jgi:hypothetical protein